MEEKRKTHTSSAVKNRYNQKHYKVFRASLKHDLYDEVEQYKEKHDLSNPQFIRKALDALQEKENQ